MSFVEDLIYPIKEIRQTILLSYRERGLHDDHGFRHGHTDISCDDGDRAVLLQYKHLFRNMGERYIHVLLL